MGGPAGGRRYRVHELTGSDGKNGAGSAIRESSGDEPPDARDQEPHEHPACEHRRRPDPEYSGARDFARVSDAQFVARCHSRLLRDRDGGNIVLVASDRAACSTRSGGLLQIIDCRASRSETVNRYVVERSSRSRIADSVGHARGRSIRIRTVVRSGSTCTSRLDMSARIRLNPRPRSVSAFRGSLHRPLFETTSSSLSSSRAPRTVTLPCACSIAFAAASCTASTTASRRSPETPMSSSHPASSCLRGRKRERSGGSEAWKGSTGVLLHVCSRPKRSRLMLALQVGR